MAGWLEAMSGVRSRLLEHPVYGALVGPEQVVVFLRAHVWAVWDFMSLLKALQRRLTCVSVPWMPPADPATARLVNEIVLGEESDEDGLGGHGSHFELYRQAMAEAGTDTVPIDTFLAQLAAGTAWKAALEAAPVAWQVRAFVAYHVGLAESGSLAAVAGAFTLGREEVIPDMFNRLLLELGSRHPKRFGRLAHYLRRHVELDGDEHGPASLRMLEKVANGQSTARDEALEAGYKSLELRIGLYDSVLEAIG